MVAIQRVRIDPDLDMAMLPDDRAVAKAIAQTRPWFERPHL
jgi:hypothetical protein